MRMFHRFIRSRKYPALARCMYCGCLVIAGDMGMAYRCDYILASHLCTLPRGHRKPHECACGRTFRTKQGVRLAILKSKIARAREDECVRRPLT